MPDGDRIHPALAHKYEKNYKQLCEPYFSEEEIAHSFLIPFKAEIQQQSPGIIGLINKYSEQCIQIALNKEIGDEINWNREILFIEKLGQRAYVKNIAKELAISACKEQLQDIRNGVVDVNFPVEIMKKYLWNLYVMGFESRVPLKKKHHSNADSAVVNARLAEMRQHVMGGISSFAEQAIRHNSFDSLRRPSQRRHRFNDDLDSDLTAVAV